MPLVYVSELSLQIQMAGAYNQIEGWFAEITRKRIHRGTFRKRPRPDQGNQGLRPPLQCEPGAISVVAITPDAMNPAARQHRGTSGVAA